MNTAMLPGAVVGFPQEMGVRELGGLRGADGRPIRHGLFYRGSALANLTDDQRVAVDALDLCFVLDLRARGEVEGREDYVPRGATYRRIAGMYDSDGNEVDFSPKGIARMMDHIQANPGGFMTKLYVSMMFGNPAVHELVSCLLERKTPVYFHCTAGKDRTGVCAAVILMLLGVDDEDIVREFLLTNQYRAPIINMDPSQLPADLSDHDRQNWAQINSVNERELRAAFDAVDARYATREDYFRDEFGLDESALNKLRNCYLANFNMPDVPVPTARQMLDTPYVKVYDLEYSDGTHYYDASRRTARDLRALREDRQLAHALPDAVSCCLVLAPEGKQPKLVLFYEYRYPTGQYALSIPSGLVDEQDRAKRDPLVAAMVREIREETGIVFGAKDLIRVVNPLLFNSPGLTDESTALLCAVIHGDAEDSLSQAGANGTERFGSFELVTRDQACEILMDGRDPLGHPYPMVTWTALAFFATDQWLHL